MSNHLLVQLEKKIDDMIETLEILRLQVSDLEDKNEMLDNENIGLKTRHTQWEQGLTSLLGKLDDANSDLNTEESFESVSEEAFA